MRYFRKLFNTTLLAVIMPWITSCKKDITPVQSIDPAAGVVSLIKNDNWSMPGKYVFFQFDQYPDQIDKSTSFNIHVFGKFTNDANGSIDNAGSIVVNDSIAIHSGPDNLYEYKFDQAGMPRAKALMGNYIDLQITGSGSTDSLRRRLYIPKQIFLYDLYKSISTISNKRSYNLSWNPDSQNMFGKVLIRVSYDSRLSVYSKPDNPVSVQGLSYIVTDNGSFVIPAADLEKFPVSSYISISISRATENSWPTDRSHIEYIAVSSSFSSPILIQN